MAGKENIKDKSYKIYLEGERSGGIEKKVNKLGSWGFFKVLYRDHMLKIFGMNLLMLLLCIPVIYLFYTNAIMMWNTIIANYPTENSMMLGAGVWFGASDYVRAATVAHGNDTALWTAIVIMYSTFIFSGGFAVIRNAFWTGDMKVFKTFFKGLGETFFYMLPFMILLGGLYYLISALYIFLLGVMVKWLAVILIIIVWVAYLAAVIYVLMLYSVLAVHKEPLKKAMHDAWVLYITSPVANVLMFVITFGPILGCILLVTGSSMLASFALMLMAMFGFFYMAFAWQTHMMKTFRLYHPVEKKRSKQAVSE